MKSKHKRRPKPPTPLALARMKIGVTQAALATELGMKQPSYSAIESGRVVPDAQQAQRIAEILKSPIAALWPMPARRSADGAR